MIYSARGLNNARQEPVVESRHAECRATSRAITDEPEDRAVSLTEFRVLSPTAILGYGFPIESLDRGVSAIPHLVAVDAGSTDPGPFYLGDGKSFTSRSAVKRDLTALLTRVVPRSIPLAIGSAGGGGASPHLRWTRDIIREVAREQGLRFRMAVVPADIPRGEVLRAFDEGRMKRLDSSPPLTREDILATTHIVAQMGMEPLIRAMESECDVLLCGRCYDPAPFAFLPVHLGFDRALALHLGKILECGAIAASPGSGRDCVLGTLHKESFLLESMNPSRRFTRTSTAAHSLYEKGDPHFLHGPGGTLDLRGCRFEELPGGRAMVSGTRFIPADPHTLKIEGAKPVGFRTVFIAGVRDPVFIAQSTAIFDEARALVQDDHGAGTRVIFHVYGVDGVMGRFEPGRESLPHEIGLVVECVGSTQEAANELCAHVRSTLLHMGYPGRFSTAGNLALLFSPSDLPCGQAYAFSLYHLMEIRDPLGFFPTEIEEVGL